MYVLDSLKKNNIPYIIEEGLNPSDNRNRGAEKAQTELVAFLNAHSILTENWASEVNKFFQKYPEIDIVGGPQLTPENQGVFETASGHSLSSFFGAATMRNRYKLAKLKLDAGETYLTSSNLICKRKVTEKVKFDPKMYPGEDPKFIRESKKAGFRIAYSPDIVVFHQRRENLRGLIKQIFNYGTFRPKKDTFKENLKKPFFFGPSLFLIYLVFLPILASTHNLFYIPAISYITLNITFSFYESIKNKFPLSFFILPFLFLTIHLSYGAGFIYGFLRKR